MNIIIEFIMSNLSIVGPVLTLILGVGGGILGMKVSNNKAIKNNNLENELNAARTQIGAIKKRGEVEDHISKLDSVSRDQRVANVRAKYSKNRRPN